MKLLNKIKINYHTKIIDDLFLNSQYEEIHNHIIKLKSSDHSIFLDILNFISDKYLFDIKHNDFYKKKLFWIVGFDEDDQKYIYKFLDFYLTKTSQQNCFIGKYVDILNNILISNNVPKEAWPNTFENIIRYNSLHQNLFLLDQQKSHNIIFSHSAFFEYQQKSFFLNPNSTSAYIYLYRDPWALFSKYKSKFQTSQEALNEQFNIDKKLISSDSSDQILENRESWNVHTSSWIDVNVLSTYRGKVININTLHQNAHDQLLEILFHLKQSGFELDINYSIVEDYLANNAPMEQVVSDLSNQEKKILNNYLDQSLLKRLEKIDSQ